MANVEGRNRASTDCRVRRSGQALVPVLFIVLILTAVAVTVSTRAIRETRASSNYVAEMQQYYTARGAIAYAAERLNQATQGGAAPPQLTPPPDTDTNGWTQVGDTYYKIDIIDTASRVNINTADANTLAKLPPFLGTNASVDPNIIAAIIDWRDSDDNPSTVQIASGSLTGAESDYYQSLNPPYYAKNAPFDTVDELLLVRGMTPQLLYGTPNASANPNPLTGSNSLTGGAGGYGSRAPRTRQAPGGGGQNPGGQNPGGQNPGGANPGGSGGNSNSSTPPVDTSASTTPLCELLTTYSKELNVASDGTPRVNIKTANAQDLQSKLGISSQLAQSLVQQRGQNGANLTSIADLMGASFRGFTRQIMQQIADKITLTDDQFRTNVVNINTAPAEVLATIPGVDATTYNTVIQARQSGTTFTGLNDLFSLTQLTRQQLQSLVDHVCTKSSVYLIRVRVRSNSTQKIYAAQALVELPAPQQQTATNTNPLSQTAASTAAAPTLSPASILQWREVPQTPGWSSWASTTNTNGSGGSGSNPLSTGTGGPLGSP